MEHKKNIKRQQYFFVQKNNFETKNFLPEVLNDISNY